MGHDETHDFSLDIDGYKGERASAPRVVPQLGPRVGNPRRKTLLIDAPQYVKVGWLKIANRERHRAIVGQHRLARPGTRSRCLTHSGRFKTGFPQFLPATDHKDAAGVQCPLACLATSDVPSASEEALWVAFY